MNSYKNILVNLILLIAVFLCVNQNVQQQYSWFNQETMLINNADATSEQVHSAEEGDDVYIFLHNVPFAPVLLQPSFFFHDVCLVSMQCFSIWQPPQ